MTDSEKRRLLTPGCNCVHFQSIADKQKGAVTFICPVHGCATLDNRPLPVPALAVGLKPLITGQVRRGVR